MDCHRCHADKPESEFIPVKPKYSKRGRHHWCRSCRNEYQRAYRKVEVARRPAAVAERKRRARIRTYGLQPADYDRMSAEQGGKCAICRTAPPRDLDVDHCHTTGEVRGLLCNRCNRVLGQVMDDPALLRAMAEYLSGRRK